MENTTITPNDMWTVKARDWFKGLILAVGTPILILLQQLIPSWTPWLASHLGQSGALISQAALSAFVAYMLKQLATDGIKQSQNILIDAANDADTSAQKRSIVSPVNDAVNEELHSSPKQKTKPKNSNK